MASPSSRLNRRSVRLPDFDYSQPGQYFVTICAFQKRCLFGRVDGSRMVLGGIGKIVHGCWLAIPKHFPQIILDAFVVMPNHIHGIVTIQTGAGPRPLPAATGSVGARHAVPLQMHRPETFRRPVDGSLATVVRSYKSAVTKQVRTRFRKPKCLVWQRGFYESVLRSGNDYGNAARYILENPKMWHIDAENPRVREG